MQTSSKSDMEFYNSIIDESIAVLGFIGAVMATWTLLAFVFTRMFTRSMMKRRLLGHAAFWMAVCGAIDFTASMYDRKLVNNDMFVVTRTDVALSLLRYSAAIISRMLVTAAVASVAFSCDVLSSRGRSSRDYGGASIVFGGDSMTPLIRRISDTSDSSDSRGYSYSREMRWKGLTASVVEACLHLGCIAVGAIAVAITLAAGVDHESLKNGFVYGLCWPWLVFNVPQVVVAAILLLFNVVASTYGLLSIGKREGTVKTKMSSLAPAAEPSTSANVSSVIIVDDNDEDDSGVCMPDDETSRSPGGSVGGRSTNGSDYGFNSISSNEFTYEYQWEAELDFLPTLTRTERLFAYVNFEIFCCLVNFVVNMVTAVSMLSSTRDHNNTTDPAGGHFSGSGFPRLESSLLYFDGIVSALRGCWLFALYGYRPGVLYVASIISKHFKTIKTKGQSATPGTGKDDGSSGEGKPDGANRDVARLVSSFTEAWGSM